MKEKGFLNHYELRRRIFCEKTTVLTNPNPMASKVKAGKNAFGQKFLLMSSENVRLIVL